MEDEAGEFEAWVRARSSSLARTAYLLTGDVHLAEDLVQDTLARVAQHWRRVTHEGAPDAYARRVMHHLAVDRWRRRRVRPAEVLTDRTPDGPSGGEGHVWPGGPAETGADVDRRLLLRDALRRLTPRQRALVSLRFYDDLTEMQTADVLGCSVSTVKSGTRDALARLRRTAPDLLDDLVEGHP